MDKIKIYVRNNGKTVEVPLGSNLEEVYKLSGLQMEHGPVSAHVNNKVEGMHYRAYKQKEVEFLDITSSSGSRAYTRSCRACGQRPAAAPRVSHGRPRRLSPHAHDRQ